MKENEAGLQVFKSLENPPSAAGARAPSSTESAGPWSVKSSARPPEPVATKRSRQPLCKFNKTSCRKTPLELATNLCLREQHLSRMLVQFDICGKEHRKLTSDCNAYCFVRRFEVEFEKLRQRRAELIRQLCGKLRSGEVIPVEIL
jgi:hypothetical protein